MANARTVVANVNGRSESVVVANTFEAGVVELIGFGLFYESDIETVEAFGGGTIEVLAANVWHPIGEELCDVRGCSCVGA